MVESSVNENIFGKIFRDMFWRIYNDKKFYIKN